MTISAISNRVSYAGDGSTTAFSVSYPFFLEGELLVIVETDSDGSEAEQTLTTDYTVSGGAGSTGTVTMVTAPASGETLHIIRDTDAVQKTDLVNNSAMDAETLEDALDRRAMREQRLFEHVERSLRVPETEAGIDPLHRASLRRGKLLRFADTATALPTFIDPDDLSVTTPDTIWENVKADHGAVGDGATDDTSAIQSAINAASPGGVVYFPEGKYLVTGNIDVDSVALKGTGVTDNAGAGYGSRGSVLMMTNTANPMFQAGFSTTFDGLSFFYPDQDGSTASPIVYEPTIETKAQSVTSFRVHNCKFINSYRAIVVPTTTSSIGRWFITDTEAYGIRSFLEIVGNAPDIVHLNNVQITSAVYGAVANTGNQYLGKWTEDNGQAIVLDGKVDGFNFSQGIIHGYRLGIRVRDTQATGAPVQLGSCHGVLFETQKAIIVDNPGMLGDFQFVNCGFAARDKFDDTNTDVAAFEFNSTGSSRGVLFSGCNFKRSTGSFVDISNTGLEKVSFDGCLFGYWAQATGLATSTPAVKVDDIGVLFNMSGCTFDGTSLTIDPAVEFEEVKTAVISGCLFEQTSGPVIITNAGGNGGRYSITGCRDRDTTNSAKGITVSNWTGVFIRSTGRNEWENLADWPSFDFSKNWPSIPAGDTSVTSLTSANWSAIRSENFDFRDIIAVGIPDLNATSAEGLIFQAYVAAGPTVRIVAHNPTGSAIDPSNVTYRITHMGRQ